VPVSVDVFEVPVASRTIVCWSAEPKRRSCRNGPGLPQPRGRHLPIPVTVFTSYPVHYLSISVLRCTWDNIRSSLKCWMRFGRLFKLDRWGSISISAIAQLVADSSQAYFRDISQAIGYRLHLITIRSNTPQHLHCEFCFKKSIITSGSIGTAR
jgi:hypothetical protein